MSAALLNPLAQRLAWALVNFLWQGSLLGLLAWAVLSLARRRSPQVRYGLACLFMLLCLVLPIASILAQGPAPAALATSSRLLLALQRQLHPWLPAILALWTVGAAAFALRALGCGLWLHRLGKRARRVLDGPGHELLQRLKKRSGIARPVRLLEAREVRGPFTTGVFRPAIFLPLGFFASLEPLALEAVLAHELAHIRRLDVFVIGLQTAVETLLFYHPVTWWLSRRVHAEREHCCDAAAILACGDPVLFARTLQHLDSLRDASPAMAAAASGGELLERLRRILNAEPGPLRMNAPALSLTLALGAGLLLAQQPPVQALVRALPGRMAAVGGAVRAGRTEARVALQGLAEPEPKVPSNVAASGPAPLPERAVATATQAPVALPALPEPAQGPRAISLARLGVEYPVMGQTPIETWPEGVPVLEAKALPGYDESLDDLVLGGAGRSTRLLRLRVPPRTVAALKVGGTSGTARDGSFTLAIFLFRTLVPRQNTWVFEKPVLECRLANPYREAQEFVIALTGPGGTPYRTEAAFSPLKAKEPAVLEWPVTGWPKGAPSMVVAEDVPSARPPLEFLKPALELTGIPEFDGTTNHPRRKVARWTKEALASLRCFEVEAGAGERLVFRGGSKDGLRLEATTRAPQADPRWLKALATANGSSGILRVDNPTPDTQTLVLVAYGTGAGPGRIELQRSPGP